MNLERPHSDHSNDMLPHRWTRYWVNFVLVTFSCVKVLITWELLSHFQVLEDSAQPNTKTALSRPRNLHCQKGLSLFLNLSQFNEEKQEPFVAGATIFLSRWTLVLSRTFVCCLESTPVRSDEGDTFYYWSLGPAPAALTFGSLSHRPYLLRFLVPMGCFLGPVPSRCLEHASVCPWEAPAFLTPKRLLRLLFSPCLQWFMALPSLLLSAVTSW